MQEIKIRNKRICWHLQTLLQKKWHGSDWITLTARHSIFEWVLHWGQNKEKIRILAGVTYHYELHMFIFSPFPSLQMPVMKAEDNLEIACSSFLCIVQLYDAHKTFGEHKRSIRLDLHFFQLTSCDNTEVHLL